MTLKEFEYKLKKGINIFDKKNNVVNFIQNVKPVFINHKWKDTSWSLFSGYTSFEKHAILDYSKYLTFEDNDINIYYYSDINIFEIIYKVKENYIKYNITINTIKINIEFSIEYIYKYFIKWENNLQFLL